MKPFLYLDYETRSLLELGGKNSVGLDNYVTDKSTEILMLGWAFGEEEPEIWEPSDLMPERLRKGFEDESQILVAFNSPFERFISRKLGYDIPTNRWLDPQATSRYLSLPGNLEDVGDILGLPPEMAKDKRGDALITLFSEPHKHKKKDGGGIYFNDKISHPQEWEQFKDYCKKDIIAEREIVRRETLLGAFPLPPLEQKIWSFDQRVNERGILIDTDFVNKAYALGVRSKEDALQSQNKITGLENSNSRDQLLPWVKERGYPHNTLRKETVKSVLDDPEIILTEECRIVLTNRVESASTSYQKLSAIQRQVSSDGRLRHQFIYMGSPRCGRWSGAAVQPHNLPRPGVVGRITDSDGKIINPGYDFEKRSIAKEARDMVLREDYDGIREKYKSVLLVIKNLLRTSFVPPKGKRFNTCDLNAIETRTAAWITGCETLLKVFEPRLGRPNGLDPYLAFASPITGISYDKLDEDIHSKDDLIKAIAKRHRQMAKAGMLATVYEQGGGGWGKSKKGYKDHGPDCDAEEFGKKNCSCPMVYDKVRTGLFGYAHGMGVNITIEQSHEIVKTFRTVYHEIPAFWRHAEKMIAEVLDPEAKNVVRKVGPNGCIEISKINIEGRHPLLRVKLPSGRYIHYFDARLESCKMPWKDRDGNDVYRDNLVYAGPDQETKQWDVWIQSRGGKQLENWTQGIARDLLACKLLKFEENDLPVVLHVHDEGGSEVDDDPFSPGVAKQIEIMSQPEDWAKNLLLGADGFEDSEFYRKG